MNMQAITMTVPTTRQKYEAKKAHPKVFFYFWPVIGTPLRRPCVCKWGDLITPKMAAFVCLN
jgi:hypothetical protein